MTLHEVINLFTYRTLPQYEVVEMARFHKVIYPRGTIKTSRDILEADKHRKVLIIDNFTIYLGPKTKSDHNRSHKWGKTYSDDYDW